MDTIERLLQCNPHVVKEWNVGIGDEHGREYIVTCIFGPACKDNMCTVEEEDDITQALVDAACTAVADGNYELDKVTLEVGMYNGSSSVYDLLRLVIVEKVTDDTIKLSTMDARREETSCVRYIKTMSQIVCDTLV